MARFVTRSYLLVQFKNFWNFIQSKFVKKIKVNGEEIAVNAEDGSVNIEIPEGAEYSLAKAETAAEGFLATYHLTKNGENVGEAINIPKDYLVKDAAVKTVEAEDDPVEGYAVGEKYIDFTVNTKGKDGNETHLYIRVADLVKPYVFGDGLVLDEETNTVSVDDYSVVRSVPDIEAFAEKIGWNDPDTDINKLKNVVAISTYGINKVQYAMAEIVRATVGGVEGLYLGVSMKGRANAEYKERTIVIDDEGHTVRAFVCPECYIPLEIGRMITKIDETDPNRTYVRLSSETSDLEFWERDYGCFAVYYDYGDRQVGLIEGNGQTVVLGEKVKNAGVYWIGPAREDVGEGYNIDFETELTV